MKLKTLLLTVLIGCIYFACQKQNDFIKTSDFHDRFVDSAVAYLKTQVSSEDFNNLDLSSPHKYTTGDVTIAVSFSVKNGKEKCVMVGKDINNNFLGNWLTVTKMGSENDGILKTEGFDGKDKSEVTYKNGKVVKLEKRIDGKTRTILNASKVSESNIEKTGVVSNIFHDEDEHWLPTVTVTAYVYTTPTTFYSLYWQTNQNISYTYQYSYSANSNGGGGTGGTSSSVSISPTFVSPDHPILDITKEMKCFTVNSTAKYYITINVNQPSPTNRTLAKVGEVHPVGHAYLTFEQQNYDGTPPVIRNIGFYPKNYAKPGSPVDVSIYGDDSQTPASVTLKITVNSNDFMAAIQSVKSHTTNDYELSDYNCTTAAMATLRSIHINLPATHGSGPFIFYGYDPGDLGEDIRELNLTTFSQQNGNRHIDRQTSPSNSILPPLRTGTCN